MKNNQRKKVAKKRREEKEFSKLQDEFLGKPYAQLLQQATGGILDEAQEKLFLNIEKVYRNGVLSRGSEGSEYLETLRVRAENTGISRSVIHQVESMIKEMIERERRVDSNWINTATLEQPSLLKRLELLGELGEEELVIELVQFMRKVNWKWGQVRDAFIVCPECGSSVNKHSEIIKVDDIGICFVCPTRTEDEIPLAFEVPAKEDERESYYNFLNYLQRAAIFLGGIAVWEILQDPTLLLQNF